MIDISGKKLPIYGKSYQGTYYFKIRNAEQGEATLLGYNGLTMDVLILTVTGQPRSIIATSAAISNTFERVDAKLITQAEWIDKVYEHNRKLLNI